MGFTVEVKKSSSLAGIFGVLIQFLPLIFFGGILLFMMRQAQGSSNQALGFGRSRARLFVGNRTTATRVRSRPGVFQTILPSCRR